MKAALLTRPMDNSPLIIFRIFFGLLISLECFGAIATGWVRRNLVEPAFTFNFIGFDWLQPLVGPQMYLYFTLMGLLGLCILVGFKYRFSIIAFTLMWSGAYFLQKTSYNNHYYLLILLSFIMCFLPANKAYAWDARKSDPCESQFMPQYVKWIIIAQLFIVYTYAAIAKLYGDWLDLSFFEYLLRSKIDYPLIGELLQTTGMHRTMAVYGILFDLLVVPALLWKRTRPLAFIFSVIFHLFNSIVFQIGIFPYMSLALTVFFFEPQTIRKLFFPKQTRIPETPQGYRRLSRLFVWGWAVYFVIQVFLPLRHHLIQGDVLWTDEGHRLSWRMMLRARSGTIHFEVEDKLSGSRTIANLPDYLTRKQHYRIAAHPDFIWQFAQRLKKEYAEQGKDVAVYAKAKVSINGKPALEFIDSQVDLAAVPWDPFRHHEWILPSPLKRLDQGPQE